MARGPKAVSCLFLTAAILAAAPRAGAQPPKSRATDPRLARVEHWLKATLRHEPGTADEPLLEVGAWSTEDLRALWMDANSVARLMQDLGVQKFGLQGDGQRPPIEISYSPSQLRRLRLLACAAGGQVEEALCREWGALRDLDADLLRLSERAAASKAGGDDNFVLRRGAILQADVAMLAPRRFEEVADLTPAGDGPGRVRVDVTDGRGSDVRQDGLHWEIAYALLEYIRPAGSRRLAPERDLMVRQWYRATAAWMQSSQNYDASHLDRAVALFPRDPDLLFLRATQHEIAAGPTLQNAVRSADLPPGMTVGVQGRRTELRGAVTFFQRALAARPDWPEAHLRLGRVLALLGDRAEAATELHKALAGTADDELGYYGALFLGGVEESAGRFAEAKALYERAGELYPEAQSPKVALSQLARRLGDRAGALRAMHAVFAIRPAVGEPVDPWWFYLSAQAKNADALVADLRRPFQQKALP